MHDIQINQDKSNSLREDLVTYACDGNLAMVNQVIASSSEPTELANTWLPNGSSLLVLATQNGHMSTVKYLLEQGADVNSSDHLGRMPFTEAALWYKAKIVHLLLQQGADRHRKDRNALRAYDFATESDHITKRGAKGIFGISKILSL